MGITHMAPLLRPSLLVSFTLALAGAAAANPGQTSFDTGSASCEVVKKKRSSSTLFEWKESVMTSKSTGSDHFDVAITPTLVMSSDGVVLAQFCAVISGEDKTLAQPCVIAGRGEPGRFSVVSLGASISCEFVWP
jgi:hypothetical protein